MEKLYSINIKAIYLTIRAEGWAFTFICLYLLLEYVRPQAIYTQLDILPWGPLILLLAAFSLILNGEFHGGKNSLNKLMVAYALTVLLSSTFSQATKISFSHWRVFFDWFIIYFLIIFIVNNEKRFFIFLVSFLLYSYKLSQHGLRAWASKGFGFDAWGVNGPSGWFQNSGELGIQMCIFVPLAISFIFATYKYLSKFWLFFFLFMPFTGIATAIATSSRGALVGLAVASIRPLLIRPRIFIKGVFILSFLSVLIITAIPERSKQRFENAGSDRTSLHRLERWRDGLDAMNKFPLLGVGFEAWSEYYPIHYDLEDTGTLLVHNIFVQCGSELGYTGLCIFSLMIIFCFINTGNARRLSKDSEDKFLFIISYGLDGALLGFLGSGFFVTVLYYPFFWIHCAMTVCLTSVVKKNIEVSLARAKPFNL